MLNKLVIFLRDLSENWDCDQDAHKYNTPCRKCEAGKLLNEIGVKK